MNYAELTDDELRLEVARRCGWTNVHMTKRIGLRGRCPQGWDDSVPNYTGRIYEAIAMLDGMTYPDGVSVEYNVYKHTYSHFGKAEPLEKPQYIVFIGGRNPVNGKDYESTADTLPRAACEAWLMWNEAKEGK